MRIEVSRPTVGPGVADDEAVIELHAAFTSRFLRLPRSEKECLPRELAVGKRFRKRLLLGHQRASRGGLRHEHEKQSDSPHQKM